MLLFGFQNNRLTKTVFPSFIPPSEMTVRRPGETAGLQTQGDAAGGNHLGRLHQPERKTLGFMYIAQSTSCLEADQRQ